MVTPDIPNSPLPYLRVSATMLVTGWAASMVAWIIGMVVLATKAPENIVALVMVFIGGVMMNFMVAVVLMLARRTDLGS